MDPKDRTGKALVARAETLCNAIHDERNADPWGGDGYLSTILRSARMEESSEYSTVPKLGGANDLFTSAQKELTIREQTAGLVKTTQDLSTLIRDLQELWLFGGLDTLADPKDEEQNLERAVVVADRIEGLAKNRANSVRGKDVENENRLDGVVVKQERSEG